MTIRSVILFFLFFISVCGSIYSQDIEVTRLPFNKPGSNNMAPFYRDSVLIFSSDRKNSVIINYFDAQDQPLFHLYKSRFLPDSTWSHPILYKPEIFNVFNNSSLMVTQEGDQIFFTKNQYDTYGQSRKSKQGNLLGVFTIEKRTRSWSRPKSLGFNSRRQYNTGHPTLGPDDNILFFVSDMEGGFGKSDIYFSQKGGDGKWGEPQNIGSIINTPESEVFPFYHSSGKLFFASNGHDGQGGMDIFYSIKTAEGWSHPIALQPPVNSEMDDYACYIDQGEEWGFFTSNRDGKDNIYKFVKHFPSFTNISLQEEDNFCFTFFENGPYKSDTLPYIYKWNFGDGNSVQGLEADHCFEGPGHYHIALEVFDTIANVNLFTVAQYPLELERKQQVYISGPDTIKVNELVSFNTHKSVLGKIKPKTFYWDLGDGIRKRGEKITHIFRTKGIYHITCGVVSIDDPNLKMCSSKEIVVIE
ncbi:PKD domain-containing protein [Marinilabiliaceae bacterium JC017]|nr:PKD domain-containing protein [Marinilabiliaceae bacterium JC017]